MADRHDLSKALRKRIRSLVSRFFKGPYDTEVDGLRFRIYPAQNYDDRKILAKGRLPENAEHQLLDTLIREGCVFVDVGANVGTYSLFAANRGANVLAIEANPETADKLAFNAEANGLANIELVRTAVGEKSGTLSLWHEPSNCGFATLVEDLTTGEWAGDWTARPVGVRPLLEVIDQEGLERIDIMKLDVEGFEDRALLPFLEQAPRSIWPATLLLETNCRPHWIKDCLPALKSAGYHITGETKDNMVFQLKNGHL
nr:FkbM family methyltransferase [Roseibium hamelinense]